MDLIYILLLKCSLFSAVFAWAWVDLLTAHRGLLDFVPKYYPISLANKPLGCAFCLSGWICLFSLFCLLSLNSIPLHISSFFILLISPFFAMAIVKIIQGNGR